MKILIIQFVMVIASVNAIVQIINLYQLKQTILTVKVTNALRPLIFL